jgi:hypothetical protein
VTEDINAEPTDGRGDHALPTSQSAVDTSGLEYIRGYYRVPARVGVKVLLEGCHGEIVGSSGPHLLVQIEGDDGPVPAHPTWEIEYLVPSEVSS